MIKEKKQTKTSKQLHRSTKRPTWMCRFQEQETWAEAQESLHLSSSFCSCHLEDLSLLPICIEWFCHHQNSLHKLEDMLKYHWQHSAACTLTTCLLEHNTHFCNVLQLHDSIPGIKPQHTHTVPNFVWDKMMNSPPPKKKFFNPGLHRSDC